MQDGVVAERVDVFGVNQQSVHVEEAGPDWREATNGELADSMLG